MSNYSKLIAHVVGFAAASVADGIIVGRTALIVTAVIGLLSAVGLYTAPANKP